MFLFGMCELGEVFHGSLYFYGPILVHKSVFSEYLKSFVVVWKFVIKIWVNECDQE